MAAYIAAHLLFLAAYARMEDWYRQQDLRPTSYLPDLLLLAPDLFRQQALSHIPERLMERLVEQTAATSEPGEAIHMPNFDVSPAALAPVDPALADSTLPLWANARPCSSHSRIWRTFLSTSATSRRWHRCATSMTRTRHTGRASVDPNDAESASHTKAAAIVARAFDAMGGLDKLLKITEMRSIVWVVAHETASGRAGSREFPKRRPIHILLRRGECTD